MNQQPIAQHCCNCYVVMLSKVALCRKPLELPFSSHCIHVPLPVIIPGGPRTCRPQSAMVISNDEVRRFLQESQAADRQAGKLLKKKLRHHHIEGGKSGDVDLHYH